MSLEVVRHRSALWALLGLLLAAALGGCWQETGPALPDLSQPHNEISEQSERLRRIQALMEEDLGRFQALQQELLAEQRDLYEPPFPLDLYKHVAFDCLNEPWEAEAEDEGEAREEAADVSERLSCEPEFLGRLIEALDERVPDRREEAIKRLSRLDELRQLRGKLRWRLSRIAPILNASRDLLASRRADLRRLRLSYERRRTEFSTERWKRLQQRFDEHEEDLDELQRRIDALEEAWPSWPDALERSVKTLYMELSKLSQ